MVKLVDSNALIFVRGFGAVHAENITQELYDRLIEANPNLASLFKIEEEKVIPSKKRPVSNEEI